MTYHSLHIGRRVRNLRRELLHRYEGPRIIRSNYKRFFGKPLAKTPRTLTEKITHRMIRMHAEEHATFTRLADKFLVRDFVKDRVGERYLVDLLWHGTDPEKMPFRDLPDRCMAKTNHASETNLILDRHSDPGEVTARFRKWLKMNYYYVGREIQYKDIPPRILIEPFLNDGTEKGLLDYRFWCLNGKPEVIQADNHDNSVNQFFDPGWNKLPFGYRSSDGQTIAPRPPKFDEMMEVATTLATGFDFVRVDMYNLKGKIVFGEMTFTPMSGMIKFTPSQWDRILGEKWP
jgi:hypothetical protein